MIKLIAMKTMKYNNGSSFNLYYFTLSNNFSLQNNMVGDPFDIIFTCYIKKYF